MFLQHLQVCGQVGFSAQTWRYLNTQICRRTAQLAVYVFPLPVTVVPQGHWSMVPWLWACSSMHGCWSLRANSTVNVKLPRARPPSDTVTKESANTHLCSSAGSERDKGYNTQSSATFASFQFNARVVYRVSMAIVCVKARRRSQESNMFSLTDAGNEWNSLVGGFNPCPDDSLLCLDFQRFHDQNRFWFGCRRAHRATRTRVRALGEAWRIYIYLSYILKAFSETQRRHRCNLFSETGGKKTPRDEALSRKRRRSAVKTVKCAQILYQVKVWRLLQFRQLSNFFLT